MPVSIRWPADLHGLADAARALRPPVDDAASSTTRRRSRRARAVAGAHRAGARTTCDADDPRADSASGCSSRPWRRAQQPAPISDRAVVAGVGGPVPHAARRASPTSPAIAATPSTRPRSEDRPGHARRRDQGRPAATISAAYSDAGAGAGIGGGRRRLEVLVAAGPGPRARAAGGGGGVGGCAVTRAAARARPRTPRRSAPTPRPRRGRGADGGPLRRRTATTAAELRAVGPGRCVLVDHVAGLHPAGPVDEEPVQRRAGQEDGARVRADVGRRLQVGGDAGRVQDVEQVLATPRVEVASGLQRGASRPLSRRPRPRRSLIPPRGRERAPGSTRRSPRRSSVRRCRAWPRGSCRGAATSVVSVLPMPASSDVR